MTEEYLPLNLIVSSLESLLHTITSADDAKEFLEDICMDKNNVDRLLSWMIHLKLLPCNASLWAESFHNIINRYHRKISYYPSDENGVPLILDQKSTIQVKNDVKRYSKALDSVLTTLEIPLSVKDELQGRITRVLAVVMFESPYYPVLQGWERYIFIIFALSFKFCMSIGLDSLCAEAFSALLFRRLLVLNIDPLVTKDSTSILPFYIELDGFLRQHHPETMKKCEEKKLGSEHFVTNMIGVMFVDNHTPAEVLLIWDQVILRINNSALYTKALISAHMNQIMEEEDIYTWIANFQQNQKWDMKKLFEDAENIVNPKNFSRFSLVNLFSFWI